MSDFDIKQHDTLPNLVANLKNNDGTVINLSNTNVYFKMRSINNGGLVVNTEANVTTPLLGTVQYAWAANDTSVAGTFNGEFEINFEGGEVQSVPTIGYISIKVHDDLD